MNGVLCYDLIDIKIGDHQLTAAQFSGMGRIMMAKAMTKMAILFKRLPL